MFTVKPRQQQQSAVAPTAKTSQLRPAPLKANEQAWSRSFSGSAKGVNFQVRIQRDSSGHLHARYQVTPGRRSEGWHLEGQVREDNTFVLKGTENGAVMEGSFAEGGRALTASFHNKEFSVADLRLVQTLPVAKLPPATSQQQTTTTEGPAPQPAASTATASPAPQVKDQPATTQEPERTPQQAAKPQWQAVKTGLKGFDSNTEVQQAILWGAQKLQVNPNDLAAVIGYESAGTFSPGVENEAARKQGKKGAVGLIQFTPSVGIPALNQYLATRAGQAKAKELGISETSVTRDGLLGMTATQQMKFVVLYFSIPVNRLSPGDKYDAIYQEILAPGRESEIWYRASDKNNNYRDNRQFDTNNDGEITRLEAAGEIREQGFVVDYFKQSAGGTSQAAGQGAAGAKPAPAGQVAPPARQQGGQRDTAPQQAETAPAGFDAQVTQALEEFTGRFVFPVTVHWKEGQAQKSKQLSVRTPYFIYSGDMLKTVQGNRARMSAADHRAYIQAPRLTTFGKGSPEEMSSFVQTLVELNPFGVPAQNITSGMITGWLKKYGIGVDCSGFVTQALDYATTQVVGKDPHIGDAKIRVNRASGSLHGNKGEFAKVGSPAEVKPGDTMWLPGHIRIVTRVGPGPGGKGIQMMIAESTPNEQLPASLAQGGVYRNGVDEAIWWFPEANRFTWKGVKKKVSGYNWNEQAGDQWETPNTLTDETLYFSRYAPLDAGRKK